MLGLKQQPQFLSVDTNLEFAFHHLSQHMYENPTNQKSTVLSWKAKFLDN